MRLLGAVEVVLGGRRLRAFDSLRLQRFLALLTLRDGTQHRSRLAFELWPDSEEGQARTNLRKLLHELRRSLPDADRFVEMNGETVRWIPGGSSEVDVLSFREAVLNDDLERAALLYRGDLLPACYDDWVLSERAKLRAEAHAALVRLTRDAVDRDDHEAVIRHSQRARDLEPTDEAAVLAQMQAHLGLGDRTAALRTYHRYAEALDSEIGVRPGEPIRSLYEQLRVSTPDRDEVAGQDPSPLVSQSAFVGRDAEEDEFERVWRTACGGSAHLLLVTGEPGIGKSRLVSEFARKLRAAGHLVASTRAYEAAGRLPWGPVVELLRSEAVRSQIDTLGTVWRRELARLLPELRDDSPRSEPQRSGDPAQRHRLFDAVSRALAIGRPRLLIIDDLQWCDAETIDLIGFVVRSGQSAPVLIVGTLRPEELPERHPLTGLVGALGRAGAATTLPLDRLDAAATAELAARTRGVESIDPDLAARLWRETEGNPLFVIEALRAGISSRGDLEVLTSTMRAVLSARIGQLSDGARRVAEAAAVIGRSFTVDLLVSTTGIGEEQLVDHVDELWRRRIIREQGVAYDFSHDKLRALTLEETSPPRRRQFHRAVATAIAREGDVEAASSRLAAHYDQAGMAEAAIDAYRVAGARAVSVSALEEGVSAFRRALSLLPELPATPARDALELDIRTALGSPLVALEGYGSKAAHQLYERAQSLCHKLQRPVEPPILRGLGLARLQGCRFDDCSGLGQALLDGDSPVARTEGRYLLGVSAFWRGELSDARRHLEGAVEAYDTSRRDEHLAAYAQDPRPVCLVRLALVELWTGDAGRAETTARSALELARDLDHLMTLGYVTTYAAIIAAESEDLAGLGELLAGADLVWKRLSERYLRVVLQALRGWLEVCEGSARGIERIADSVGRSRADGETLHLTYTLLLLARAHGLAGDVEQGRAATREALAWTSRRDQRYLEAELRRIDGELAHLGGAGEAAATSLRGAVEVAAAQEAAWLELRALHSFALRFPEPTVRERLRELVGALPSGRDLPPFRAAADLVGESA